MIKILFFLTLLTRVLLASSGSVTIVQIPFPLSSLQACTNGQVVGTAAGIQGCLAAPQPALPWTTSGDTLYYSGGAQRLAKGSDGQVLTLASGLPSWATPSSGAPTNNPTFTGLVTIPNGTISGLTGNTPGVGVTGAATSGFAYADIAGAQSIDTLLGGRQVISVNHTNAGDVYSVAILGTTYCDPTGGPCDFGTTLRDWVNIYTRTVLAGGKADGTGVETSRGVWYQVGGWGGGGNVVGLGIDGLNGNEFYFRGWDNTAGAYLEPFNMTSVNRITTISAPDDTAANATAAQGMVLKSANKTAGTGNSSPTVIDTGTSVGGTVGAIDFKIGGTAKYQITTGGTLKNVAAGNESTGAGSAILGANSPAATLTAPYTWVKIVTSDGSTAYIPAWK